MPHDADGRVVELGAQPGALVWVRVVPLDGVRRTVGVGADQHVVHEEADAPERVGLARCHAGDDANLSGESGAAERRGDLDARLSPGRRL